VTDFATLLRLLAEGGVDCIIVGGFAATLHGSSAPTRDLDLVYAREAANLDRLVAVLAPHHPYLRGAPPGLPFKWDRRTLEKGLNFTLITDLGAVDLLGEIAGGGGYRELRPHSQEVDLFGVHFQCLGLNKLIEVKRAAGRARDLQAVAELESLRDEKGPSV
jgi:predicted nucleotidyltransferase